MDSKVPSGEEPPVLRIKKDAIVDREFHYSREERLAHQSAPAETREMRGFLGKLRVRGRKRGGFGFVIGSLVVLLVALVVYGIGVRDRNTAEVAGYRVTLRAVPRGSTLPVEVSFQPAGNTAATEPALVTLILPGSGEAVTLNEAVPPEGSALRWDMPYAVSLDKTLKAEIEIGGKRAVLTLEIKPGTAGK